MADARSLLRARRQDAHITHPFAAYTSSGQLRCTACATAIKTSTAWEGHVGSKAHRLAVSELRRREQLARVQHETGAKRKATLSEEDLVEIPDSREASDGKRARIDEAPEEPKIPTNVLPSDFFSDPSSAHITVPQADESDEDESETVSFEPARRITDAATTESQLELEWEQFQASLASSNTVATEESEDTRREAYLRATIYVGPEIVAPATEGIPLNAILPEGTPASEKGDSQVETEEEKRLRKEREERELIMDRLIEEERTQEEADERVELLKARIEALKQARDSRKEMKSVLSTKS